jgi:cytochrome b
VRSEPVDDSVYVWDVPTRVFHWLLAASFVTAWLTRGQDRYLDLHVFAGYLFFSLLVFRIVWGFVGGRYARFSEFSVSFREGWRYLVAALRGKAARHVGHNPAGAWAIFLLLTLGFVVTATGLVTLGGEERQGLASGWAGFEQAQLFHQWHDLASVGMVCLVLGHIGGVVLESGNHRENLVGAMFNGRKRGAGESSRAFGVVAATLLAFAAAGAVVQFHGYAGATDENPYLPFRGPALPQNETWNSECGGCHLAFHPSLLPARSWSALLENPGDHFGDELGLDKAALAELGEFASQSAAGTAITEAAWKISRSVPADAAPRRITETAYWKKKHRDVAEEVWGRAPVNSRANCGACHLDANLGTFEDAAMRIPELQTGSINSTRR